MKGFLAIVAIGVNSFREAIRSKVLAVLVLFAVLLSVAATLLGQMSLHEERRVTLDVALFLSTIFLVVIAIYSTVTSLHTELERRTIYTLLSKPIARWQFLIGKYLGVVLLLLAITAGMFALASVLLVIQGFPVTELLAFAYLTAFYQACIVTAWALMLASFSTPLLTGMITACVFVIGNVLSLVGDVAPFLKPIFGAQTSPILRSIKLVIPNFEQLNLSTLAVHEIALTSTYLLSATMYTLVEVICLLALASFIFRQRDFA